MLRDGRKLAYAEYGDGAGLPVLYFHGSPSSRLEPLLLGDAWRRLGLRVIAPDRPGVGRSEAQPSRRFGDWPRDVAELADALGLARFAILGNSGGGPYVVACAAAIPERITHAVIVSGGWDMTLTEAKRGLAIPNRVFLVLARYAPPLVRLMLKAMTGSSTADDARELAQMKNRMPLPDYEAFSQPGRVAALRRALQAAVERGTRGTACDVRMYVRGFDVRAAEARIPITMYHGEKDANSPIALARRVASMLPGASLVTFPDDAHLSTLCNHVDEIASSLRG